MYFMHSAESFFNEDSLNKLFRKHCKIVTLKTKLWNLVPKTWNYTILSPKQIPIFLDFLTIG